MNNRVVLITPTGGRPEAFALCEKYMKRQTYKGPLTWLLIDDCFPTVRPTMGQMYIRGPRVWQAGLNTQRFNMEEAMKHLPSDTGYIFVIEDDDYYAPNYIEVMVGLLRHAEIAGLSNSRYYGLHVPGSITMHNYGHASLSQTAIRASLIPELISSINSGDLYIDIVLWRQAREKFKSLVLLANTSLSVGIKGMPGRMGITGSHRDRKYFHDPVQAVLKSWLGADFALYTPYIKSKNKSLRS